MKHWILILHLLILPVFYVLCCDLEREYNENGDCCKKCDPGTRMSTPINCKDPICQPCKEDEYQDGFTKDVKCKRHPYCNPELHLESVKPITKTHISVCVCMKDYHCASGSCATCARNRICPPGTKVSKNATQKTDTECDGCPFGTFSSEPSQSSCQPWTECEQEKEAGTAKTDRICKGVGKALHIGVGVGLSIIVMTGVCFTAYKCCKGKWGACWGTQKKQLQKYLECLKDNEDIEAGKKEENQPLQMTKQEAEENEVKDDESARAPVCDSRGDMDHRMRSEGGRIIQQEEGKEDVLSQSESCPST